MHGARDVGIVAATTAYEKWMAGFGDVHRRELADKHDKMAEDPFQFLRATFYDWAVRYRRCCPEAADAPSVLGVGDLHVENFGLWRDEEGRLVWGVNDFDEADVLPYTNDLVRLLTSAALATGLDVQNLRPAAKDLLTGYATMLEREGRPFVLAERHGRLGGLALQQLGDAEEFWNALIVLPDYHDLAAEPRHLLLAGLPGAASDVRLRTRRAGLGSLGRTRATVTAEWRGGLVAREVKRVLPSAWNGTSNADDTIRYGEIVDRAVRCPDPRLTVTGSWVTRRLAPDGKRIELTTLKKSGSRMRLIEAMGSETANIHLGTPEKRESIRADLSRRPKDWLADAAHTMVRDVTHRHQEWARHHRREK